MASFGGFNYTGLQGVNIKGSAILRYGGADVYQGTMSITGNSLDGARAWSLPNKNGTFAIMGTFAVQLPSALSNKNIFSTTATVSGITAEDGLNVQFMKGTGTYVYGTSANTAYILIGAEPGAGNITLTFMNLGQGTGYLEQIYSYVAVR